MVLFCRQEGNIIPEATERNIRFVSWNICGFQKTPKYPRKFEDIYEELGNLKADIAFIQETHTETTEKFKLMKDWNFYFTVYHNKKKGVAILIKKGIKFSYKHGDKHEGSYIVIVCQLDGKPFTLVNVYNSPCDEETLKQLTLYLHEFARGILVVGGDFNSVLNSDLDRNSSCNTIKFPKCYLRDFISSLSLVDVWGQTHPAERKFTWFKNKSSYVDRPDLKILPKKKEKSQNESQSSQPKTKQPKTNPQTATRIDMFFVPYDAMQYVKKCNIESSYISDHNPVILDICVDACDSIHSLTMEIQDESIPDSLPGDISQSEVLTAIKSLIGCKNIFDLKVNKKVRIIDNLKCIFNKVIRGNNTYVKQIKDRKTEYLILTTIFSMRLEKYLQLSLQDKCHPANFDLFTMLTFKTFPMAIKMDFLNNVLEMHPNDTNNFFITKLTTLLRCENNDILLENSRFTSFILILCLIWLAKDLREKLKSVVNVCCYRPCVAIYMDSKKITELEELVSEFQRSSKIELNFTYSVVEACPNLNIEL